jgi:hypothetical protein
MGTSTDAYLMYGYDLGSEEDWKIQGLGEYGEWKPDWLNVDEDAEDEPDWTEEIQKQLRKSVGFTETDWEADGFYKRQAAADAQIGVELESHCSGEYPMYVLAAKTITAGRGYPVTVEPAALQAAVLDGGLDEKLARAIEALGIQPVQEKPAWLLCSYWG